MFNFYLNNYRSFNKQKIRFSKVNILIGENNSGKSSVLKFLLMLKQTLNNPTGLNLSLRCKNGEIDLGTYYEIINKHDVKKDLEFGFEFGKEYNSFFINFMTGHVKLANLKNKEKEKLNKVFLLAFSQSTTINYQVTKNLSTHISLKTEIENIEVGSLVIKPTTISAEVELGMPAVCDIIYKRKNSKEKIHLKDISYDKSGFNTLIQSTSLKERCDAVDPNIFNDLAFLLIAQNFVEYNLVNFNYINPLDSAPDRLYIDGDANEGDSVSNIEDVINLLSDENTDLSHRKILAKSLSRMLAEMGIAKEVKIVKPKNSIAMEMRVRIGKNSSWDNIKDVGYGVPLQIPILFQALLSELSTQKGQSLFIEQPEIHIYPKLQGKFIETILGLGNRNNYFIETHSEHIVRKLQLIVKQKKLKLKPDDVSINYFRKPTSDFEITNHKINEDGTLNPPIPTEFFDTSYSVIKELMF